MNIIFRVDSSLQIGTGHLMRCLTLAKRYKQQAAVYFIMRDLEGNLSELIKENGFEIISLPKTKHDDSLQGYEKWLTVKQTIDVQQTINAVINLLPIDLLVIDHYAIDEVWERKFRPYVAKIMVIDDLANRKHDCDILLDQNFYLNKDKRYRGLVPESCELLLGFEYALLREEFYEIKKHLRKRDGIVRNILVFYGGSDLTNETMKALCAVTVLNRTDIQINVVVGASNPHKVEIEKLCAKYSYIQYHCQVDNMAEFMNQADLMLGAGGSTTWERLYLELPAIVTAIADNQIQICEDCAKQGYIDYLGRSEVVEWNDIYAALLVHMGEK